MKDYYSWKAHEHVKKIESLYNDEIQHSIINTRHYNGLDVGSVQVSNNDQAAKIILDPITTTDAVWKYSGESITAALNFASYKNPGGKFLEGSMAQEESICHDSTLFNVLKNFEETFYKPNHKRLNKAMYNDNLLYSKDIIFVSKDLYNFVTADVITSAAPNFRASHKYFNISSEIKTILEKRIRYIYDVAAREGVDNLILGAYGCGVFGNNPTVVCKLQLRILLEEYLYKFNNVIFAVPYDRGVNYKVYKDIYDEYFEEN